MERGELTERGADPGSRELVAEISRAMVRLYKDFYGKGPTKARTHLTDDIVVCLLEGGFLTAERTLVDAGRGHAVAEQREALHGVLRRRFVDTVEELTGRKVATFVSGVDLETETNAELFVLEPSESLDAGDEHAAVDAWAAQTRRHAQDLRRQAARLRESRSRDRRHE